MNFWTTMLATACGYLAIDFLVSTIRAIVDLWKNKMAEKSRKIGFGDAEEGGKKTKGAVQMRKIGFGAND